MSKTIIALVLCFILCFTFIMPPQQSSAIAFVPAMPVVLGLLKAAGLTALTVGGANYLYNEFYNYIPSEMRTAIDSLNNGSVAVLAGGILSYLSPFALTKSMGENSAMVITGNVNSMHQLDTWYSFSKQDLINVKLIGNNLNLTEISNTDSRYGLYLYSLNESSSYVTITVPYTYVNSDHYCNMGDLMVMWESYSMSKIRLNISYINNLGVRTLRQHIVDTSIITSYPFAQNTVYLDRSIDYSGSISADRALNPDGDIKPEAVIVPGSVQDFLNSAASGDAMPSDYINAGAEDVAVNGWTGSDTNTGDTTIDLSGTNDLLTGIRGVADTIATGVGTLVDSVASGVTALTGTIATGIGALTDFVVPDVTLDFSGFQNLGVLMVQKFPFSLPWDLKNLVMSFNADPEPIKFENLVIYKNPYNEVMYDIDFDLTEWEWLAAITRYFILASFSLGLIFKTRDLIRS